MIGHESPSRLQQAFELLPSAFLLKPVRPSGVYTAIFFAINGHARDRQLARTVASLEARHRARRLVMKAVLRLMERHGIDDDEAYRRLRKESMRQRLTVEDLCSRILDSDGAPAPTSRTLGRQRLSGRHQRRSEGHDDRRSARHASGERDGRTPKPRSRRSIAAACSRA